MKRFAFYLFRWQMSTPILWIVVSSLGAGLVATIIANLIGGSIFFWVDRLIFSRFSHVEWETVPHGTCADCGTEGKARRLVLAPGGPGGVYDRREDDQPQFRCEDCSRIKMTSLLSEKKVAAGVSA